MQITKSDELLLYKIMKWKESVYKNKKFEVRYGLIHHVGK